MKMLKKAASIVLASAMVVSLAACGSSNDKVHQQILIHLRLVESDLQQEIMQFTEQR